MKSESLPKKMIGKRIREVRKEKGLTVSFLAEKVGLSQSMISQIETGQVSPSLETLWKLSYYLETPVFKFFKHVEHSAVHLTREADQKKMKMLRSNVMYHLLLPTTDRKIELFKMVIRPGESQEESPLAHTGEECGYLMKGTLNVIINDTVYTLEKGDSISFDSTLPHSFHNPGDDDAVAIWAMTPPYRYN